MILAYRQEYYYQYLPKEDFTVPSFTLTETTTIKQDTFKLKYGILHWKQYLEEWTAKQWGKILI